MIQASELKFENIVLRRKSSDSLEWVPTRVNLTYLGLIAEFPEDYKPIPLTEEILKKVGFQARMSMHPYIFLEVGVFTLIKYEDQNYITFQDNDWQNSFEHITCLHQLQNLYFALMGKELEITI